MTDREQAIKTFEWLIGNAVRDDYGIVEMSVEDARRVLALLKEQEPRVLTLDEVCGGGECWIEGINGSCGYADCIYVGGTVGNIEVNRTHNINFATSTDYMKTWRCWDKRPTEEQRKAVKWK